MKNSLPLRFERITTENADNIKAKNNELKNIKDQVGTNSSDGDNLAFIKNQIAEKDKNLHRWDGRV